jgi:beta-1,2-mannobiose phosphorylase / 1,2-beta-oligomannan phosphorylase
MLGISAHTPPALFTTFALLVLLVGTARAQDAAAPASTEGRETTAGWVKSPANPFLGGKLGTCFDISVLKEGDIYRMWLSWRPKQAVALTDSRDGVVWSDPKLVLGPNPASGWEDDINRPIVLRRDGIYHIWYTGFNAAGSAIGYATSSDGSSWQRQGDKPVLTAEQPWEKQCVMCPHVLWDETANIYKMWYSAGDRFEPNAIGYATSPDGKHWTRHADNPIFTPLGGLPWEHHKVTACQVIKQPEDYLTFYIGFRDEHTAQIGVARSADGITNWRRHPSNPIIRPGLDRWDHDACYKPYAIFDGGKWMLWYNGRHGSLEQIGLATHDGKDLGFDQVIIGR